MGAEQTPPSRFASSTPLRNRIEAPVEDFSMISLESVEKMLQETIGPSSTPPVPSRADGIPPPVFGAKPIPQAPVAPPAGAKPVAGGNRIRFADMLHPDGMVDMAAVYRFGQVPDVQLSAELILQALANLPADIPKRARQMALQVTVNSLTQAAGIPVDTIVADARLRHTRLSQFDQALRAEQEREWHPLRQSVTELEALIAEKQSELETVRRELQQREAKSLATYRDCELQLQRLQEVIDSLVPEEPKQTSAASIPTAEEELPPHLRDDSVRRLLGITDESQ